MADGNGQNPVTILTPRPGTSDIARDEADRREPQPFVEPDDAGRTRVAQQERPGRADPTRGIREFVVGTGGAPLYPALGRVANSELARDDTHGVLKLTLYEDRFDWEFIPVAGKSFSDRGSAPSRSAHLSHRRGR